MANQYERQRVRRHATSASGLDGVALYMHAITTSKMLTCGRRGSARRLSALGCKLQLISTGENADKRHFRLRSDYVAKN